MTTSEQPVIDPRQFRNVLGQFCTGITVITTFGDAARATGRGAPGGPEGGSRRNHAGPSQAPPSDTAEAAAGTVADPATMSSWRRSAARASAGTTQGPGSTANGYRAAPIGFACQSFAALSLEPPLVLFCPTKESRSWQAIQRNGSFCVNMLAEEQQPVCARFGSREPDKFAGIGWHTTELNLPALDGALATIQCTVDNVLDGGDHYIVIGRVQALSESTDSGRPLLFYRGQYTAIEPEKTTPAPWRADLEHFLTTTTLDTWL